MKKQHPKPHPRSRSRRERGAVLILTVVVIMVLTTLGMAMVTFSGTEERTATTYRDSVQVRAIAESGVRIVQQMFADPNNNELVPHDGVDYDDADEDTLNEIGIYREVRNGADTPRYTGVNKRFFRGPYRGSWAGVFGGKYDPNPDVEVYDLQFRGGEESWLDDVINPLLTTSADWNEQTGAITSITFYAPPIVNGRAYGICKVRVTAEKRDGDRLIARETIEAIIGDNNLSPAILGNGDVSFKNIEACGNGCEQIHSNEDVIFTSSVDISGGNPPITAVGDIDPPDQDGIEPPPQTGQEPVEPPMINPWDISYRPTSTAGLNKYYLLTVGPLPVEWTNADKTDNPDPVLCGMSYCQDYGLEYTGTTANDARANTDQGYMYKWSEDDEKWVQIGAAANHNGTFTSTGATETFTVTYTAGTDVDVAGGGDTAEIPFNKLRRPTATFKMGGVNPANSSSDAYGVTFLVDGNFETTSSVGQGGNPWYVAIIAAGHINIGSSSDLRPATARDRIMLIAGRDIRIWANYNNDLAVCSDGAPEETDEEGQASAIIAAHEQIFFNSQSDIMGLVIAEHRTKLDPKVDTNAAITSDAQLRHSYVCGFPAWPWSRPTKPIILSMNSATN